MTRRKSESGSGARRKPQASSRALGALPLFGIGTGALWLLYQATRVRGGKEWRGYAGTVTLKPGLVYRLELLAPVTSPLVTSQNQAAFEGTLSAGGARNFLWNLVPDGMHVYFDQSFQEPTTLTFGKGGVGDAKPLTARRLDGLDWDAP